MRSKAAHLSIANRLVELYRHQYYRTTSSGRKVSWDEPGERDDNPDVIAHNKAVAAKLARERKQKEARERLKKQGAVPKKAGKPMYEAENKPNLQSQVGKVYYSICPDDNRYYKTIFIKHNPFTNALQPLMSNKIFGTPPAEMDEISPLMLQRLMRVANSSLFS